MKKKNIVIIAIIVLLVILLFPIRMNLKDGGSVKYKALLYTITDYHKLEKNGTYIDGIGIEILGVEIINTTDEKEEANTNTEERIKLKDLKITAENIDTTKLVKFNDVLYGKSNALIDYDFNLDKTIGKINLLIGEEYMPELNGETNNKDLLNCDVLEANGKIMVLNVDNTAVLFEAIDKENIKKTNGESLKNIENTEYSSFVGTVLEETTKYMIVEPNEDEQERKSSDKIQINYETDHIDYLYGVGRKVIIYYTGVILESYPAKIYTNNISIDGYKDFEITVKETKNVGKKKVLNNKELASDRRDFNLYYYGLDEVNVKVNNENMSLEQALRSGKITLSGIEQKANEDFPNAISYDDGGSMQYHYKDYTIIKIHKLDGNRDIYIGNANMKLNDLQL